MVSDRYGDGERYGYGRGRDGYTDEDRQFFEETDDDIAEQREESLIDSSESTDELGDVLEEHESDNLKPEEFGLRSPKARNIYCDKNELYEEIRKYQREGNPTDALGEMLIKIALHMSTMARFWRYSHDIKEELVNNAILQMLKSVPKFNLKVQPKGRQEESIRISFHDLLSRHASFAQKALQAEQDKKIRIGGLHQQDGKRQSRWRRQAFDAKGDT